MAFFYLVVFTFLVTGCKDFKKDHADKNGMAKDIPMTEKPIQKSKDIFRNVPVKDSVFIVTGLPFDVNTINCYWEYKVKKVVRETHKELNIVFLYQKLKAVGTNKILFETANEVDNSNSYNLYHQLDAIKNNKEYNLECEDINNDGYCDFKIVIERAGAGGNTTYKSYLFNPKNKKFEYSEVFSGTNMEYDKEKNRISFLWKMSVREYIYDYQNLKKNKKDIAFSEEVQQSQDTVIYVKYIGKKLIKKKKVVLDRGAFQGDEVSEDDFKYLLERNKR